MALIALSGKKQSGKDSAFDYIETLLTPDTVNSWSFAEPVKRFCQEVLGLRYSSLYGTNEEKNAPTHLLWEDFPVPAYRLVDGNIFIARNGFMEAVDANHKLLSQKQKVEVYDVVCYPHRITGYMSGRNVQQYWATELIRKQYPDAFVNKVLEDIDTFTNPDHHHFILDCRFSNEVEKIKARGGYVIRFARELYDDPHESETALDQDKFNWNEFSTVIWNQNMSVEEKNVQVLWFLKKIGVVL